MNSMKGKSGTVAVVVVLMVLSFFFGGQQLSQRLLKGLRPPGKSFISFWTIAR